MRRLQRRVKGKLISYWISPSGSVCDNDVMALHEILDRIGRQPQLTLFVNPTAAAGWRRCGWSTCCGATPAA